MVTGLLKPEMMAEISKDTHSMDKRFNIIIYIQRQRTDNTQAKDIQEQKGINTKQALSRAGFLEHSKLTPLFFISTQLLKNFDYFYNH